MRLGTSLPSDKAAQVNGQYSIEKAVDALATAGIRGCLTNFPGDESQWEPYSRKLKSSLGSSGVELLEYNSSFLHPAVPGTDIERIAEDTVRLLELAEETGCLNVVTCVENRNSIGPDRDSRSQAYYDTIKATCDLIASKAQSKGLKARLLLELVYTTVVWSPTVIARLVDEIDSPNVRAHMDIANCLTFENIFDHSKFMQESFEILGDRIHSAHLKDVRPIESYFPGLMECLIGDGVIDLRTYLKCLDKMPKDFPAVIEHMSRMDDIKRSYDRTCAIAHEIGVEVWT